MKRSIYLIISISVGFLSSLVILAFVELAAYKFVANREPVTSLACMLIYEQKDCVPEPPLLYWRFLPLAFKGIFIPAHPLIQVEQLNYYKYRSLHYLMARSNQRYEQDIPWSHKKIVYAYDKYGRRVALNPSHKGQKRNKYFLATFGGSWVHGDWLKWEEALPEQIARTIGDMTSYNYGYQGGGLGEMFATAYNPDFKKQLNEDKGIFLVVYTLMQAYRVDLNLGNSSYNVHKPRFTLDNSKNLVYAGTFYESYPFLLPLFLYLNHSALGSYFELNTTTVLSPKVYDYICAMLVTMRDKLKQDFPQSHFAVLSYEPEHPPMTQCLQNSNITMYEPFINSELTEGHLPDGHPDAETHRRVAEVIKEQLINNMQAHKTPAAN